jgi:hypothetical protein
VTRGCATGTQAQTHRTAGQTVLKNEASGLRKAEQGRYAGPCEAIALGSGFAGARSLTPTRPEAARRPVSGAARLGRRRGEASPARGGGEPLSCR